MAKNKTVSTDNVQGITRLDVLVSSRNKAIQEVVKFEIQLKILDRADPDLVVAEDTLAEDSAGKPISSKDVKASEMIVRYQTQLEARQMRVQCIDLLIKEEE